MEEMQAQREWRSIALLIQEALRCPELRYQTV